MVNVNRLLKALKRVGKSETLEEQRENIKDATKVARKLKGENLSSDQIDQIEVLEKVLVKTKAVQ